MAQMIWDGLYSIPMHSYLKGTTELEKEMANLDNGAYLVIGISHALAVFAAGFISSLVVGTSRMTTGMVAIITVFIYVVTFLFSMSFPVWFVVTNTVVTAVIGFMGVLAGSRNIN